MTILIRQKNWTRAKPNASKRIQIVRRKKKRFVAPSRASTIREIAAGGQCTAESGVCRVRATTTRSPASRPCGRTKAPMEAGR